LAWALEGARLDRLFHAFVLAYGVLNTLQSGCSLDANGCADGLSPPTANSMSKRGPVGRSGSDLWSRRIPDAVGVVLAVDQVETARTAFGQTDTKHQDRYAWLIRSPLHRPRLHWLASWHRDRLSRSLRVRRPPFPHVGGVEVAGACQVLWVVEYSIEVGFNSLVEHTFVATFVIDLFLVNFRRDLCERENQHSACGRDGIVQKFTAGNMDRHRELATHLCASRQVFHLLGLTKSDLLLCGRLLWGSLFCGDLLCGRLFCGDLLCGRLFCGDLLCGRLLWGGLLCGYLLWGCFFGGRFLPLHCCAHCYISFAEEVRAVA
jgi:hypothetical protein